MVEEILPNLYRIEVPLPDNPLKVLNSYVVRGPDRNLIIDTGLNRRECQEAMRGGLEELNVDLAKTDFFITHLHADHIGLVSELATPDSKVFLNQQDAVVIGAGGVWQQALRFAYLNGFPGDELQKVLENHPGHKYGVKGRRSFSILGEGDILTVGTFIFMCVETPGHTGGHMCLYEPNKRIFVAGDHILNDITPNISLWSNGGNPLGDYLASLDKVYDLDITLVLTGHRSLVTNCRQRIGELRHHHQQRMEEILSILRDGSMDAYRVASRMTWSMSFKSWDQFPVNHKWFALGEAIAHLKYLEEKGLVYRQAKEERTVYSLI